MEGHPINKLHKHTLAQQSTIQKISKGERTLQVSKYAIGEFNRLRALAIAALPSVDEDEFPAEITFAAGPAPLNYIDLEMAYAKLASVLSDHTQYGTPSFGRSLF